jgi:hypothetical protein
MWLGEFKDKLFLSFRLLPIEFLRGMLKLYGRYYDRVSIALLTLQT